MEKELPSTDVLEKLARGGVECTCEAGNVLDANIPLASLNGANVRTMKAGGVREFFLRPSQGQAGLPHFSSEGAGHIPLHASQDEADDDHTSTDFA